MKPSDLPTRILHTLLFFLFILSLVPIRGGAQENEPKIPPPPRQVVRKATPPAPVRPVPRPLPARVQPRVQVRARPAAPPGRVQPAGNLAAARPPVGRGAQNRTQVNPGGAGYAAKNPGGGGHLATTAARGGPNQPALRLPPNARSMAMAGGGTAVVHPDGRRWIMDNNHHVRAFVRPGLQAKFNEDGKLSSLHVMRLNNNMLVARGARGERETVAMRPGGVFVVTFGKDRGYVQRPIPGRLGYFQRTYMAGGRPSVHVYHAYRYRGIVYLRYVPAYHYQPQFYQWVNSPWPAPAAYTWGWNQAPWVGFYSGYFTPAPAYPTAALWLTDFVVAKDLEVAYQNHQEYEQLAASPAESGAVASTMSPDVKNAISQEVAAQVSEEQQASAQNESQPAVVNGQAPAPALDPNQRTFVVSQSLDVTQAGQACTLSPGDVISRTGDNLIDGNKVGVNVLTSKAGDCTPNTPTEVGLAELQEMHNEFREQVDAGLSTLASSEGQSGLPAGPAADPHPVAEGTAVPDRDVAATLTQQQNDADAAEGAANDGANAVGLM